MNNIITSELLSGAFTYESYINHIKRLLCENKTTGNNQSEKNIYFTRLNLRRALRIEKTTVISDELKNETAKINEPVIFLVIAEAWCGDVVQSLPVIQKIAKTNPLIQLKIILRDENESVMNEFLTNGAKSIPVCIIISKSDYRVIGKWGPRPAPVQLMVKEYKKTKAITYDELTKNIQLWYAKDKTRSIQKEFQQLLENVNFSVSVSPVT